MASPATTETMEIRRRGRRRLVGAIAIVVLLVVFVPMILDSEPRQAANEPSTVIPPRDNAPALPPPSKAAPKPAPAAATPAPAPATPAPAVVTPAPAVVTPVVPPKVAVAAPKPAATAAAPKRPGFAVQVGAFRDEETLRQAREKLVEAKIAHYTERVEGGLTRLRAGPFPTREEAEQARVALKLSALDGKVVPLP
jgi:DedD protein